MQTSIAHKILALSLEKSGLDFIGAMMSEISDYTNGSFCFLGILKDRAQDVVLGIMANDGGVLHDGFEYCMTDQPCRLIYDDQVLSIPCDVQKNFERKKGSGLESFFGFPIKHPGKGVVAHFASYHKNTDEYAQITPECIVIIQSLLTREVDALLKKMSLDEIKGEASKWRTAALTDKLTGCWNRRALENDWEDLHSDKECEGSVAILDIDFFKKINDSLGHDVGDLCLQSLAELSQKHLHEQGHTFYRLGGEEFCVLAPGITAEALRSSLEELQELLKTLLSELPDLPEFTFSAGVSDFVVKSLSDSLKSADERLYAAKAEGRNRII